MKEAASPVEPHYTLQEAVERFFPGGHITVRSLRTEIKKGRLQVSEVAGKFLVSESAIARMLEACACRERDRPQDCTSSAAHRRDTMFGSSEMERLASARAAIRTTFETQKKR
jgi:hypothetical protein